MVAKLARPVMFTKPFQTSWAWPTESGDLENRKWKYRNVDLIKQ